jgi:hypothetical protein
MNKQEQIDRLQFRIERIEAHLAEQHIPNNFGKCSGKPNSCDRVADIAISRGVARESTQYELPDFIPEYPLKPNGIISIPYGLTDSEEKSYIEMQKQIMQDAFEIKRDKFMEQFKQPESTQYELPDFVPDWKDAPEWAKYAAMDKKGSWCVFEVMPYISTASKTVWLWEDCSKFMAMKEATNASRLHPDYWKNSLMERPADQVSPKTPEIKDKPSDSELDNTLINLQQSDYTHLLPEGYEFCSEQDASDLLKVELMGIGGEIELGCTESAKYTMLDQVKPYYRPIRPIQYMVSVHEAVTAEPDPYQVDWEKAPEGTVGHAYRAGGAGYWYCIDLIGKAFLTSSTESGLVIPDGLDWKKSLRLNPKLK